MASRNYAMAYDTPYNEKLLAVLRDYDMRSDTNGQPDIFSHELSGGSLEEQARMLLHPHLPHFSRQPLPYKIQPLQARRPMATPEMSGGLRPPGMVEPFVHSSPFYYIQPGNLASYPIYNAVEMRAVGGACPSCEMAGGKFGLGSFTKELGTIGKDVAKIALKEGAKEGAKMAVKGMASGSGKKPRGRPRKIVGVSDPEMEGGKKFNFGKALKSVGKALKPVGKELAPIARDVAKTALKEGAKEGIKALIKSRSAPASGGARADGRKARAEIVKKIMAEKGMKMIDASKYVKEHGLY